MKKQYQAPNIKVMTVENQPLMAASNPQSFDSNISNDQVDAGSITANKIFLQLEEEGEEW